MTEESNCEAWGRFQLAAHLGSGGMGDVHRAYDPSLKRHVALKIIRYENPDVMARFLREAQAQARVEHRNVCKIYESGECEGRQYIAMQYIDGQTLNKLAPELHLEEKLNIMRDVAMGLHAAHRQGLIHRDIKPSNIMIQRSEDGNLQPFVMDFGIAREQAAPGITSTGVVVGTPFYMSPEQASGRLDAIDRRSDIYNMGVTLYELLGGSVPIKGDTPVDILMNILQKDPLPLRKLNPRIPLDLETIVMKCLEKDPNRRYGSAKELADDLQRFLDGDPIHARQTTLIYRIKRKLVKNKWAAIVAAVATLVIILLVGLWMHTRWQASQQASIAQELGQEVEKIESTIRYAHLLPIHNISQEKDLIRDRMYGIEKKMAAVGKVGQGPGHFALGRGYMALQDYEKAKEHIQKAWDTGYRSSDVAFELGRVLGEYYMQESERASRIDNAEMRTLRQKEVEDLYRKPALSYLRVGSQTQTESRTYVEALITFYEKKYEKALALLKAEPGAVKAGTPWQYEIKLLEGNIYLAIGMAKSSHTEAQEPFGRAEAAYSEVIRIGESDIRGYLGLGRVLERKIMIRLFTRGGDLQPLVDEAISHCRKALQIDPDLAGIHTMMSSIYRWLGRHQMTVGQDAMPSFKLAVTSGRNALVKDPDNFEAHAIIGITSRLQGQFNMNQGRDPTADFLTAAEHFGEAIKINPTYVMAYNGLGNVQVRRAQYDIEQGRDPYPSLRRAIANFEKALSINPGIVNIHNGLAATHWFAGGTLMTRGEDPRLSYNQAIHYLQNAIHISPGVGHFHSNLGFVYFDLARYELNHGLNPQVTVGKARQSLLEALALNPKGNELHLGLLNVAWVEIQYDYMQGRDPLPRINKAWDTFNQGLSANPNSHLLYMRMIANLVVHGRYLVDRGRDAGQKIRQAENLWKKAFSLNANYYEIYTMSGEISLLKARGYLQRSRNPGRLLEKAGESFGRAQDINPKDATIYLARARLLRWRGEWEVIRGMAVTQTVESGLSAVKEALAVNPRLAEAHVVRGLLKLLSAKVTVDAASRGKLREEAERSIRKGIEINQNLKTLYGSELSKG